MVKKNTFKKGDVVVAESLLSTTEESRIGFIKNIIERVGVVEEEYEIKPLDGEPFKAKFWQISHVSCEEEDKFWLERFINA